MAINFRNFQAMHESNIPGRARKIQSDIIMDATFTQDIQYQVGYFFDYYHCSEENRLKLEGFDPEQDSGPIPIDVKFIAHAHKTIEKDDVTMHIQFRPGYQCAVDYYDEVFGKRYNAIHPVGLYVWLRGEDNIYRRWLVVALADYDRNQFPTFEVLKCDEIYRWISDGKYYEFPGVSRSQNSYNSGLWVDYKFQQPEDQTKFCLPLNRDTEHLYYNTFLVLDANVLTEPRVFQISKVNRTNSKGVAVFTCTQELANTHTLKADYDDDGNVIAWWADWKEHGVEPVPAVPSNDDSYSPDEPAPSITSSVTCSGKPQFKIGGSAKTFTVTFKDNDGNPVDMESGGWSFIMDDKFAPNTLFDITTTASAPNKIKIKFLGDDSYIGKIITIVNTTDDITSSIDIEVIPL